MRSKNEKLSLVIYVIGMVDMFCMVLTLSICFVMAEYWKMILPL